VRSSEEFLEYYKKHSTVLGKKIVFIENGISKEGIARDINETGGLVVEVKNTDGSDKVTYLTLSSGEISLKLSYTP
jgi:BirA family biotin operon repressor/biotin-[acetyl-CoA-carboxylase] ligase